MLQHFKGTGVAIVTPFDNKGNIDYSSFEKLIEHIVSGGCEYIVAMGTTGEVPTLTTKEKEEILSFVVKKVNKRCGVVVGIGGNSTLEVVNRIKSTSFEGVDGLLSVCPYYNKPQQEGIYQHFKSIAENSPVPVILYNVPGRTGVNISADTTLRLAHEVENIVATKEASANFMQIMEIEKFKPIGFTVISGDDALTLPLMACGAEGVISVVANAYPKQYSDMVRYALNGDYKKAAVIHYELLDFCNALFIDGSPAGIKAALEILGLVKNNLRLPLVRANEKTIELLETIMNTI